jgi:hypothetical protein
MAAGARLLVAGLYDPRSLRILPPAPNAKPFELVRTRRSNSGLRPPRDSRLSRMVRFALILLHITLSLRFAAAQTLPPEARLVMSHFKADGGGGDERLYISWSPDGFNWTCLNGGNPVWQPPNWQGFLNVVRDPSIIYANGSYWVAYTCGNYGKGNHFGLVKSTDLLNWTFVASVDVTLPGATDQLTWNPVFFQDGDGSVHATIAISPVGGSTYNCVPHMRVHEIHPINADWTQWSTPVPLDIPDSNTNEGWVWKEGDTYHIKYVSFVRFGQLVHATSKNLVTGWVFNKVLGYGSQEGGMILPKPGGGYRLFLEGGNGSTPGYKTCDLDETLSNATPQVFVNATVPMRNGKMCAAPNTTNYAQWQASKLSAVPLEHRAPSADADDDGLANLIEHSMDTDPLVHTDLVSRPLLYARSIGGELYPGVAYETTRTSADVSCIGELKIGNGPWTSSGIVESVALLSNGALRYHFRSAQPVGMEPVFFRLAASMAAPPAPLPQLAATASSENANRPVTSSKAKKRAAATKRRSAKAR